MDLALLDTDTLSELLKQRNPQFVANAAEYLREHRQFAFSVFARFEISRGHKERGARTLQGTPPSDMSNNGDTSSIEALLADPGSEGKGEDWGRID